MMRKLRVCIIGAGALGTVHARNWLTVPEVELVAVADPIEQRAEALGEELGIPRRFTDHEEALQVEGIDAVSVAVPSALHRACSVAAMERGCHVICEKPVAVTMEDALAMKEARESTGVKLAIGFCKRFMEQVRRSAELVQGGTLGRPVIYRHISGWEIRPKPWIMDRVMGGGPVIDIAVHYFDQWRVIFASEPVRVKASGTIFSAGAPELPGVAPGIDSFALSVEYASGDIGVLSMSWGLPLGVTTPTHENIIGPRGAVLIEGSGSMTLKTAEGEQQFGDLDTDMHPKQLAAFAQAIREDGPVAADIDDGIAALKVSLAALESIETGQAVEVG